MGICLDIVMKNTLAWLFQICLHLNLSLTMRLKNSGLFCTTLNSKVSAFINPCIIEMYLSPLQCQHRLDPRKTPQ